MNDKLTFILDRPLLMLLLPWVFYYLFDLGITHLFDLESRGWAFANITAAIGFASSCVFFFWMIPSFFLKNNGWVSFSLAIVFIVILMGMKYFLLIYYKVEVGSFQGYLIKESIRLFDFLIVTSVVWGFYALINTIREKNKTEIKYEQLEFEHKSLQLSPHFLLNLIGDITGKSIGISSVLFEDLRHYTKILRYGYLDAGGFNSLAAEIDAVQSYFHGQVIRFGKSLSMKLSIDGELLDYDDFFIPRMVLLTLVENVFKHGVTQDPNNPIVLSAFWEEGNYGTVFCFETSNLIKKKEAGNTGGFGISTVKRLLDYYLPDYSLVNQQDEEYYQLKLTINYATSYQNWPDR
ncbi:MAG: histidine kinase [Ignavibacteria bacterium]|nr:histidine kinase [Ignavibacteria bacterium]